MLMTDLIQEYSETAVGLLSHIGMDNVRRVAQRLTCQAVDALDRGGFAPADRSIEWGTSLRYFGQEHTLDTPLEEEDDIESLCRRFDALHKQRYGHTMSEPSGRPRRPTGARGKVRIRQRPLAWNFNII